VDGYISLAVYDILGKKIRDMVDCNMRSGRYTVLWDGKDNEGIEVGTGPYFLILKAGKSMETKKIMFVK
jgi:flagellar hook assembly protein FlgD